MFVTKVDTFLDTESSDLCLDHDVDDGETFMTI